MHQTLNFVQGAQNIILDPSIHSVWPLLLFSFLNDLIGIFPFALVLAGQLLFLKTAFTLAFVLKLLVFAAVPVGVGASFGSIPFYLLAYFGGRPLIRKYHKYLHFSWDDVDKINKRLQGSRYDEIIFLLLRCTPILPSIPIDLAAGVIRMRFIPFMVLTITGSIVRMMLTMLVVGLSMQGLSQF